MSAKHQFIRVRIPAAYGESERKAIGQEIIEHIRDRTEQGVDKDGKPFPKYSREYIKSVDFKNAGKSAGQVDLRLSGDMMTALQVLDQDDGTLTIGYKNGTAENARADGNIRGTYGQDRGSSKKARPFLGITKAELGDILEQYPLDERPKSRVSAEAVNRAQTSARRTIRGK